MGTRRLKLGRSQNVKVRMPRETSREAGDARACTRVPQTHTLGGSLGSGLEVTTQAFSEVLPSVPGARPCSQPCLLGSSWAFML